MTAPPVSPRVRGRDKSTWIYDEEGEPVARVTDYRYDPPPRDPDLMLVVDPRMRRRDIDPVAVDRVVYGRCSLLEVTPCDRVEALSRLRAKHPNWSDEDIATWVAATADAVAFHTRGGKRYRYGWLHRTSHRAGADDDQ